MTSDAVSAAIAETKERVVEIYATPMINVATNTSWELSGSKPGYFPISVEYYQSWAGSVVAHPETINHNNGNFYLSGSASSVFGSTSPFVARAVVVWVKI